MTAENLTRTVREVPMERVYTQVDWTAIIATAGGDARAV